MHESKKSRPCGGKMTAIPGSEYAAGFFPVRAESLLKQKALETAQEQHPAL